MERITLLLATFCLSFSLQAQIFPMAEIDSIFADYDKEVPGCAIGIFEDGFLTYSKGYGLANMEYQIPNDANAVFRIGSTSKQFTAACIIRLVEQGKLQLEDKLRQFFPDFPAYADQVTIQHLLNHTSGIRDYLMVAYLKGLGDNDFYTDEDVMQWLVRQQETNFEPGAEHLYSNSGYWLLGQIVNQVAEMNMAEFAEQELFKPLGMDHTHFHNDHNAIVPKRASGYRPVSKDEYKISMTTLDMIGDGGIFTSINDIKKWDDAYYQRNVLSDQFWKMMTQRGVLNNGDTLDYAAGLYISVYKGLKTVSHGGAFVGFRAELMRFPDQKLTIAVFANRADANPTILAYRVANILLKEEFPPKKEEKKEPTTVTPEAVTPYPLTQMVGLYEIQAGIDAEISIVNDSLQVHQLWDSNKYMIVRKSGNTFYDSTDPDVDFVFSDLKDGFTQTVTVVEKSGNTVCKRKEKIDPATLNLEQYVGSYYSKELDVTYQFKVEDHHLMYSVNQGKAKKLTIKNGQEFIYFGIQIRFNDDASAFELQGGRAKNLMFTRI